MQIYIIPSASAITGTFGNTKEETMIPAAERRVVFAGIQALSSFHKDIILPAFEKALVPLKNCPEAQLGDVSASVASQLAMEFVSHAPFIRMYSTYIK